MRLKLEQDKDRHKRQCRLEKSVPDRCFMRMVAVQHISRPEHHRKLGQLRRLQREGTACKVDPAVGAVGILRAEQRGDEQHNGNDVEALVHIPQGAIVDV